MRINKSGFTIVELAVVIFVIAILATITLVSYSGVQAKSRDTRRITDVENIEKAMELYYSDHQSYPTPTTTSSVINSGWYSSGDSSWNALSTLLTSTSNDSGTPAIDLLPKDPTNTTNGKPFTTGQFVYAVYVKKDGSYCGAASGQMYMIVYKLEKGTQTQKQEGRPCTTSPIPASYYAGASYFLSVK